MPATTTYDVPSEGGPKSDLYGRFEPTEDERSRYGALTTAQLRAAAVDETPEVAARLLTIADALELDAYPRLADTWAGWGWAVVLATTHTPSDAQRSKTHSTMVGTLRLARQSPIGYDSDDIRRREDLADALVRGGFTALEETPSGWWYLVRHTLGERC